MIYTCSKCNSNNFHTEQKGSQTGLYCSNCGKWVKWLGQDELRAFLHSQNLSPKSENSETDLKERLERFVKVIDETIDNEMENMPLSPEDAIRKNAYCLALNRTKSGINNILAGKEYNAG